MPNQENNFKKYFIGLIITVLASSVFAATGWNFKVTSEISEKYVLKHELEIIIQHTTDEIAAFKLHNETDHRCIQEKLDKIYSKMLELHAYHTTVATDREGDKYD